MKSTCCTYYSKKYGTQYLINLFMVFCHEMAWFISVFVSSVVSFDHFLNCISIEGPASGVFVLQIQFDWLLWVLIYWLMLLYFVIEIYCLWTWLSVQFYIYFKCFDIYCITFKLNFTEGVLELISLLQIRLWTKRESFFL